MPLKTYSHDARTGIAASLKEAKGAIEKNTLSVDQARETRTRAIATNNITRRHAKNTSRESLRKNLWKAREH
jgi:hypothetical protein